MPAPLQCMPVMQAGAVRWVGWALAIVPGRSACLRCVFEDMRCGSWTRAPRLAWSARSSAWSGRSKLRLHCACCTGDDAAAGALCSYEALAGSGIALRQRAIARQVHCPLCSGRITDTDISRYAPKECAA